MGRHVLNPSNFSTFVDTLRRPKILSGSVGDNLAGTGAIPSAIGLIVVALYPKTEISPTLHHLIVSLLVVVESLAVVDVILDVTTADSHD